jgi:hypothetical protein
MRIIDVRQQSETWERWRNRPTASEFGKFVTAVRGDYSSQATGYAAKIVAKRLGVYTEPPPSFWMEWGTEHEPNAKHAYTLATGREIQDVGFVIPDKTDAYGCSPDGLIGDDGLIEIKCPAPETLIAYHAADEFPQQYKPQVQGQLLITGRAWCDFYVWHPELTPFCVRVEPDAEYQARIATGLLKLLREIERIESHVSKMRHELVSVSATNDRLRWDDD